MFWKKKSKKKEPTREEILEHANARAAAARDEIGEDTLDKIRQKMMEKENSPMMQAKRKIEAMDQDKLRDNISYWMKDKK